MVFEARKKLLRHLVGDPNEELGVECIVGVVYDGVRWKALEYDEYPTVGQINASLARLGVVATELGFDLTKVENQEVLDELFKRLWLSARRSVSKRCEHRSCFQFMYSLEVVDKDIYERILPKVHFV